MKGLRIGTVLLPAILMVHPALAAKRAGEVEIAQSLITSGAVENNISPPPPGPYKSSLRPVVPDQPVMLPARAAEPAAPAVPARLAASPPKIEPGAYPPVDFDPEANRAARPAPPAPDPLPTADPARYPPLPDDNGEAVIPLRRPAAAPPATPPAKSPAPVQARTMLPPPAPAKAQPAWPQQSPRFPRAGWPRAYAPRAPWPGAYPPAYGANPYARMPQPDWRRAPGWPNPYQPYPRYQRPYPVQPRASGQMGRPVQ